MPTPQSCEGMPPREGMATSAVKAMPSWFTSTCIYIRPGSNLLLQSLWSLPNIPPPTVSVRPLFYLVCDCFSFAFGQKAVHGAPSDRSAALDQNKLAHLLCVTRILRPQHSARNCVVDGVAHRCTTAPNIQMSPTTFIAANARGRHLCAPLGSQP